MLPEGKQHGVYLGGIYEIQVVEFFMENGGFPTTWVLYKQPNYPDSAAEKPARMATYGYLNSW